MINVNLMGTFHFIKASLPRMRRIGRTVDQHRRPLYHRRPVRWEFMVARLTRLASLASGDWWKHCNRRSLQTTFMSHLYFLQKQKLQGSIAGFFGAAFGSAGGVGGGGIFVAMLSLLIIGFDPKSATTISKCTSTKAFLKGVETWKKESIMKKEAAKRLGTNEEVQAFPGGPSNGTQNATKKAKEPGW